MIKILLTSDIHLGSEIEKLSVPENYRLKTFKKLSYLAKSHDLFLIAGDLFHNNGITEKNMEFVAGEFARLRESGVEIIYSLGDHESGTDPSLLSGLNASKIFYESDDISPYRFSKDNQDVFIYGLAATTKRNVSEIKKESDNGFHLGLFHADIYLNEESKATKISMIKKEDIILSNLDFYALGHNHQFKLFKSSGRYIGAYPGSPEAVTIDEKGDRYALSIIINNDEIYQIKRLTVNSLKLDNLVFDCSSANDLNPLLNILKDKQSGDTIIKILLTGKRTFKLDQAEIEKIKENYLDIFIEDKSSPAINVFANEFADEESLRGEFFSILCRKITNNEVPPDIDVNILSELINKLSNSGVYTLEDLCNYWNA